MTFLVSLSAPVSRSLVLNNPDPIRGMVFAVTDYYRWHDRALWEWMRAQRND